MDTRERILDSALTLFSEKGYGSVSVREIAEAVGIKAPSLYKHFSSKKDIFDALLEKMSSRYRDHVAGLGMDGVDSRSDAGLFSCISDDSLVELGTGLFRYFLHDPYTSRFRRMMTLDQYGDPESAALLSEHYFDGPKAYETELFRVLLSDGVLKGDDPELLAMEFYSPIFVLLTVCDRQPEREGECTGLLERCIRNFEEVHRVMV